MPPRFNPNEDIMELTLTQPYLHLPVKNGDERRRVKFFVDGRLEREFEIELPDGEPDFWVFMDVSDFVGKTARFEGDDPAGALETVIQSDDVPGANVLYKETDRPQFHFSSRRGWLNDPNGLVYHDGEYHLYYQHNPYGWAWGNMHWGHAVSKDLVHWKELPVALYPKQFGDWCFSGSAAVDVNNSGGFQTGDTPALIVAYTSTGRGECIAYSNDNGRTFKEIEENPVVEHVGRDPKILWHEPTNQWVMAVYHELGEAPEQRRIAFFTSPDLKQWTEQGSVGGFFECPELFELPIEGKPGESRWIVYAGNGDYMVGQFDGKEFVAEHEGIIKFHYGNCFYASQTFSNIPADDGRRIQIAWGTMGSGEMPFNQQMQFPSELTLHETSDGLRMFVQPAREIELLHAHACECKGLVVNDDDSTLAACDADLLDIRAEIEVGDAETITFTVHGIDVIFDVAAGETRCLAMTGPLPINDGKIEVKMLVDRMTLEIFVGNGEMYMPGCFRPDQAKPGLSLTATGGRARADVTTHTLKSAWID
jgi:fructan beta-fructosidase